MTKGIEPTKGKKFEIDINEGHYPNIVNTNIHNRSEVITDPLSGKKSHPRSSKSFTFGVQPDVRIQLEAPIKTDRIRFRSNNNAHFNIAEFRIYAPNENGYPNVLSPTADTDIDGLQNLARCQSTKISVSGILDSKPTYDALNMTDGKLNTRWVTQGEGEKWIEFDFGSYKSIGCIDFINGWQENGNWKGLISDYSVEFHNGTEWITMSSFDIKNGEFNFARDFKVYGFEWNEKELIFYFDGKEIRREKNEFCHSPSPIWLSLAIIPWHGKVTDAIDGTFMEVDYVRYYKKK